tara:strand:- start:2143 stop:3444 length:1302 start_codon:yes stop_codon:yes gene_type:complete
MYNYKIDTLKNGLKILTVPNKETKLIILTIFMKLGNDIETSNILEIGHFIEHLFSMFTSSKYPDGKINRENFAFKNIDLSAEIINKNIKFTLEFKNDNTEYVFDLISNALLDFKVDEDMFKQEKNAVIEELNEIIKDSDYKFDTKINSIIFKGHQREYSQKQRLINTRKLNSNDIAKYFNTYFTSKNYVIGIFGDVNTKLYNIFKSNMEYLKNDTPYTYSKFNLKMSKKIVYHERRSKGITNVSNLKIIFKINCNLFDDDYYTIISLLDILCGDLNSLLLKKLRNESGLVYDCEAVRDIDEIDNNISMIYFSTLCSNVNLLKVISHIFDILKELKINYIDKKYIKAYKSKIAIYKIKDNFTKKPDMVLNSYLTYLLWNKPIVKFNKEYDKLSSISLEKIKKIAYKLFNKENIVVCYDGNKKIDSDISKLVNLL